MTENDTEKNKILAGYLIDLIALLKESAIEAKKREYREKDSYSSGYSFAYYEMISLMQQQAEAFQINLDDLKLDDIDADKDLL